jgi:hypothetical protein
MVHSIPSVRRTGQEVAPSANNACDQCDARWGPCKWNVIVVVWPNPVRTFFGRRADAGI